MRVYGAVGDHKPDYMDISNFHTSYYNPGLKDKWNVVCVVYNIISMMLVASTELSGLIAARMTYLCEKCKIPKGADGSTII